MAKPRVEVLRALLVIGTCGVVGVLVDLDHALSLFLWRYVDSSIVEGRLWHTPAFLLSCLTLSYLGPRFAGLHLKLVLMAMI